MTLYAHTYKRPLSRTVIVLVQWWHRLVPGRAMAATVPDRRHALMAAVDARRDDARAHDAARR